jgi:hypothetical protein
LFSVLIVAVIANVFFKLIIISRDRQHYTLGPLFVLPGVQVIETLLCRSLDGVRRFIASRDPGHPPTDADAKVLHMVLILAKGM